MPTLILDWAYRVLFLTNSFCLLLESLHSPTLCSNLAWAEGTGHSSMKSPTSHYVPDPNSSHFLKTDGKCFIQNHSLECNACEMGKFYCIHTTPFLRTLRSDFSHMAASQHLDVRLCQNHYIFGLPGLLVNKCNHIKSVKIKGLMYLERRYHYKPGRADS